jgi:hypothetical protein
VESGVWILILEGLLALALVLALFWWTLPKKVKDEKNER